MTVEDHPGVLREQRNRERRRDAYIGRHVTSRLPVIRPKAETEPLLSFDDSTDMKWKDLAQCRPDAGSGVYDPRDIFFDGPDGQQVRGDQKTRMRNEALAVCRSCLVQAACLQYALEHDEAHGIWGGRTERERRSLQRSNRLVR